MKVGDLNPLSFLAPTFSMSHHTGNNTSNLSSNKDLAVHRDLMANLPSSMIDVLFEPLIISNVSGAVKYNLFDLIITLLTDHLP